MPRYEGFRLVISSLPNFPLTENLPIISMSVLAMARSLSKSGDPTIEGSIDYPTQSQYTGTGPTSLDTCMSSQVSWDGDMAALISKPIGFNSRPSYDETGVLPFRPP